MYGIARWLSLIVSSQYIELSNQKLSFQAGAEVFQMFQKYFARPTSKANLVGLPPLDGNFCGNSPL